MVQRSEANLQQMKALLAEAREDQTNKTLLDDNLIHELSERLSREFRKGLLPEDLVEMNTRVYGMEITVDLEWDGDQFEESLYNLIQSVLKGMNHEN